jgi:DNA-binding NtrC family response regulator
VVERAAILSSDVITIADLPEDPHLSPFDDERSPPAPIAADLPPTTEQRLTLREHREASERAYIVQTLCATDWNISRAAVVLGVERTNLHKKIRAYGIRRDDR